MTRKAWRQFNKGLWLSGGRDEAPDGALRRATGVAQIRELIVRSARGSRVVNLFGANQFIRFNDALFQGRAADVLRDGVVINAAFPQSGVLGLVADGGRLSFLRMPPQIELVDWLFVAGGNNPFKVQGDGTLASKWGIDAPADGMTATYEHTVANSAPIEGFESQADWTLTGNGSKADDGTIKVSGTNSVKITFSGIGQVSITKDIHTSPKDLTTFVPGGTFLHKSADQDYIQFWFRGTNLRNVDHIEVAFSLAADGSFNTAFLSRRIDMTDDPITPQQLATQASGVGAGLTDDQVRTVTAGTGDFASNKDQRTLLNDLGRSVINRVDDTWMRIQVAKATFDAVGLTSIDWSSITGIRVSITRVQDGIPLTESPAPILWIDDMQLYGGSGLQGNYVYYQTFKNSVTGSRSNPQATATEIDNVNRQGVKLGNIQQPTDTQVDVIEIWRSVGNAPLAFHLADLDVGTLLYTDRAPDFRALWSAPYLTTGDPDFYDTLGSEELTFDNAPPPSTIREVLGGPHLGRAWALDSADGQRGRLFFSPAGRPESLGGGGFVEVVQPGDELTVLVLWNDVIFVFSKKGLHRIVGDTEPFIAQEVFGAPGTLQPDTAVATPYGIVYQAPDGVRLFDGNFSNLLAFESIAPIARGYTVEDVDAFTGFTATFYRDDYWIADGQQTLVCNLGVQTWRRFDLVLDTLYSAEDDALLLAAVGFGTPGETISLEDEAADVPTSFEMQTPSLRNAVDVASVVQRVFIELETGGETITPTLVYDDSEVTLPAIVAPSRTFIEYARLDISRLVAVRLTGSVLANVIVYGVECDYYVPGAAT